MSLPNHYCARYLINSLSILIFNHFAYNVNTCCSTSYHNLVLIQTCVLMLMLRLLESQYVHIRIHIVCLSGKFTLRTNIKCLTCQKYCMYIQRKKIVNMTYIYCEYWGFPVMNDLTLIIHIYIYDISTCAKSLILMLSSFHSDYLLLEKCAQNVGCIFVWLFGNGRWHHLQCVCTYRNDLNKMIAFIVINTWRSFLVFADGCRIEWQIYPNQWVKD